MIKPFKAVGDDFVTSEVHLNEIMVGEDEIMKESRKMQNRIIDSALKEEVVDLSIILCLCVQLSRKAFFREVQSYVGTLITILKEDPIYSNAEL